MKRLLAVLLALSLGACITPPRPQIAPEIGRDTAAFSLAYARAANNQVLLNILQARERLPRHYMTVSGVSDAPAATYNSALNLAPVGLGAPEGALENSALNLSANWRTAPSYGVTPLGSDNLARAFYTPLTAARFEYFWRIGWANDILVQLFAEAVVVGRCENLTADEIFAAGLIVRARADSPDPGDCRFHGSDGGPDAVSALARRLGPADARVLNSGDDEGDADFAAQIDGRRGTAALVRFRERSCSLLTSASTAGGRLDLLKLSIANPTFLYEEHASAAGEPTSDLSRCASQDWVAFVFRGEGGVADVYVLDLRSLDQTVYFLGQRLRPGRMTYVASDDGTGQVPLFQLYEDRLPCDWDDEEFASGVEYRGRRYWAGAPWPRSRESRASCAADQPVEDRTGTVLTLMTQLYAMGAQPDALAPPVRLRLE